jgi:cobalamin biosynthesis Mg chelatase CobN
MTEIKISDEDVEIAAEAGFSAEYRWRPESWNVLSEPDKDSYRSVARAVLEALVASGWRREADVLREAAEHLRQREREMVERGRHSTQGPYPKPMLTGVTYAADVLSARASEAEQYVSAGTRQQEDQERDEENEHG